MKIYDDVMPLPIQNQWEMAFIKSEFPWVYLPDATWPNKILGEEDSVISFGNTLFDNRGQYISPYFQQFYGGISIINDIVNKDYSDIYRFRVGLIIPEVIKKNHHNPHTDYDFDHITVLYYVNDTDGDTFFLDNGKNIIDSISPKKGRIVVFDGNQIHASSSPSKGIRVVVNINYI